MKKKKKDDQFEPRKNIMFEERDWLLLLEVQMNVNKLSGQKPSISELVKRAVRNTFEDPKDQLIKKRSYFVEQIGLINRRLEKLGFRDKNGDIR